ncbi:MAG TPA: riboflavin synthase [Candidatus Nanopelagicales bacterium]|jgi:riboflavin synthase|nr:riboflavin synthase [Candidatus Nanopelagicales bacterium]
MFTGIVEELGEVVAVESLPGEAARLTIAGPVVTTDATHGASIAVDGVCLTVTTTDGTQFRADVMSQTLRLSTLGTLGIGDRVNLERPLTLATRLGGHLVQGHVDGVGRIEARTPAEHWDLVRIALPEGLGRYVVAQGSIAVDGVSLTVVECADDWFAVSLIPTTLELTTLGRKGIGDPVNLEVDVTAKYVERLVAWRDA